MGMYVCQVTSIQMGMGYLFYPLFYLPEVEIYPADYVGAETVKKQMEILIMLVLKAYEQNNSRKIHTGFDIIH